MNDKEAEPISTDASSTEEKIKKLQKEKRTLVAENKRLQGELEKSRSLTSFMQYIIGLSDNEEKDKCILILKEKLNTVTTMLEENADHQNILECIKTDVDFSSTHYCYEKGKADSTNSN